MNFLLHYMKHSISVGCMLIAFHTLVSAQQTTYIGPASGGDWFSTANWDMGLPAAGNNALIGGGNIVNIPSALNVNFEINNFGTLNVSAPVTIAATTGKIANSGTINMNTGSNMVNNNIFQNFSGVMFAAGATFTNETGGTFSNNGTFTIPTTLLNKGTITNNGTINATNGTIQEQGTFTNSQVLTTKMLTVAVGSTFTNEFGSNLTITGAGASFGVLGNVVNNGIINNQSAMTISGTFTNNVSLINNLNLTINAGGTLTNSGSGTITNNATMVNNGTLSNSRDFLNTGTFTNNLTFNNNGTIDIKVGGTFTNNTTGTLMGNFGSQLINRGTFSNKNAITTNGATTNEGTFTNDATFTNDVGAVWLNKENYINNGTINSIATMTNDKTFTNAGTLNVNSGSIFTNNLTFTNATTGVINNNFEILNKPGATLTNNGRLINNIRMFLGGTSINNAYWASVGDITIETGATFTNNEVFIQTAGNIINQGTLANTKLFRSDECSTIHNKNGTINNISGTFEYSGILFQRGTLSGLPLTNLGGYLHTNTTSSAPSLCLNKSISADVNGDVKVYATEVVAFSNFDSCQTIIYRANGLARPLFACSDIGTVKNVNIAVTTRLGDSLTCVSQVTPIDVLAPTFSNCPSDVVIFTADTSATATWTPPTAVDNCSAVNMTSNFTPGSSFKVGITGVNYIATDIYGNAQTCQFKVDVIKTPTGGSCTGDNTGPVFTNCPSNITLSTFGSSTPVVWTTPTVNDACLPLSYSTTAVPGTVFQLGTTTVKYTAKDGNNNTSTCQFTVTVTQNNICATDVQKPIISNCPANIFASSSTTLNGAIALWKAPNASDNCNLASLTANFQSGSVFPIGATTVTYTATDGAGNTNACSFVVTVAATDPCPGDVTGPVLSGCPANITKTIASGTSSTATWAAPTASDGCGPVTLNATHVSGAVFPLGNTAVVYQSSDKKGNKSTCAFVVTVVNVCDADTTKPTIVGCPANITIPQSGVTTPVSWTPATASDNCSLISFNSSCLPGSSFPVGSTIVGYTATDLKGNIAACTFLINVVAQATCTSNGSPINESTNISAASAMLSWNSVPNATGYDVYLGTTNPPTTKVGTDVASTSFSTAMLLNTTKYYWYVVPKTVAGAAQGCASSATSFTTGTGGATTLLNITCPANVAVNAAVGATTATANYTIPNTNSTCPAGTINTTRTVGLASGSAFPIGTTQVCYTATNGCGNTKSCCFNVVVTGTPSLVTLNCPSNINITAVGTSTTAVANYINPVGASNCPTGLVNTVKTSGLASGSAFPIGSNQVCFNATDGCGSSKSCCFSVTVNAPAPTSINITCPSDVVVTAAEGTTTASVTYAIPTSSSSCTTGTTSVARSSGLASGGAFPLGTSQVCYIASDGCGNTKSCCFNVVVNAPSTAPNCDNIVVTASGSTILINGLVAPITQVQLFNSSYVKLFSCAGNCSSPQQSISNLPNGSYFVKVKLLNATWGTICSKEFNVVVNAQVATTLNLTCPSDITITANVGATSAVVNYPNPTTNSTCTTGSVTLNRTAGPASGASFPIGSTQICFSAVDGCGNNKSCCFNVVVNAAPTTSNCDNITVTSSGSSITVNGLIAPITQLQVFNSAYVKVFSCIGNCNTPQQIIGNLPNGSYLVKAKLLNASYATICGKDFNIVVGSTPSSLNISCPPSFSVSAVSGASSATANYANPTTNTTCTSGAVALNRTSGFASGAAFPLGTTQVCYAASDGCGNTNTCCFSVVVNAPIATTLNITCPAAITVTAAAAATSAIVNYTTPTTNTTCTSGAVALNRTSGLASGVAFPVGTTQVCYSASDGCGNTQSCCFSVVVNASNTGTNCDNVTASATGNTITINGLVAPITQVQVFNPAYVKVFSCAGNCNSPQQIVSNLPNGTYLVKVKLLTSAWATICSKDINVTINSTPTSQVSLSCPSDIVTTAAESSTGAVVTYSIVTSSSCAQSSVALARTAGLASGSNFPIGATQVCYSATDVCGGSNSCCFNVTVNQPSNCAPSNMVFWSLDGCNSTTNQPSASDYSEFTPTYQSNAGFASVSATNVTRSTGTHTCTLPRSAATGVAMCVSGSNTNTFTDNASSAIRFSVNLNSLGNGTLSGLNFWNVAPTQTANLNGEIASNNYPQKFGVRVLKNGTPIYKNVDFTTAQVWNLSNLNFATLPAFTFTGTATFTFEILAYNPISTNGATSSWAIDDIQITGCGTNTNLQAAVEALVLLAQPIGESVELKWISTSHQPTKHFMVERSEDGHLWYPTEQYDAYSTQDDLLLYNEVDTDLPKGLHHYRVVQYFENGSQRYSNEQKVSLSDPNAFALFPNPASDEVTMELSAFHRQNVSIQIINAFGIIVHTQSIEDLQENNLPISLQRLSDGHYTVLAISDGVLRSAKLVVSRNR